jgi:hypothetical protein
VEWDLLSCPLAVYLHLLYATAIVVNSPKRKRRRMKALFTLRSLANYVLKKTRE